MQLEKREIPPENIEVREKENGNVVEMYPAVFNEWSQDLGGFKERIKPGAFKESIENDDIIAAFNHNHDIILGRNTSNTLKLEEDEKGLKAEIDLPDNSWGGYVKELIERGDISGGSFVFDPIEESWESGEEIDKRELEKVNVYEVGPVVRPAYLETEVDIRTAEDVIKERKQTNSPGVPQSGRADGRLDLCEAELKLLKTIRSDD